MSASEKSETAKATVAFDAPRMIEDLRTLVEVESPSHDPVALGRSAAAVASLLERELGTAPDVIDGPAGPHVHWRGGPSATVLIVGHHDTVFPMGALADRPFTIDDDGRITGPGVFDMKGGIVTSAHAVAALADRSAVEMLFTCDEEVGSATSRALVEERAQACGRVLVLEPAGDGGAVKIGRKGVGTFTVDITGKAAHAGLEPEKGVNALVEAAHQVLAITEIAAVDAGTTVTPTVATAGTTDNVVPATARLTVDVRVTAMTEAARVETAMASLVPVDPAAGVSVRGRVNRPPLAEDATAELFAAACAVAAEVGLDALAGISVGGGSDGNFTAAIGVPTLDGLGVTGGGAHADHEWVDAESLPQRAALLHALLGRLID